MLESSTGADFSVALLLVLVCYLISVNSSRLYLTKNIMALQMTPVIPSLVRIMYSLLMIYVVATPVAKVMVVLIH